jgi:hypothetical protein
MVNNNAAAANTNDLLQNAIRQMLKEFKSLTPGQRVELIAASRISEARDDYRVNDASPAGTLHRTEMHRKVIAVVRGR